MVYKTNTSQQLYLDDSFIFLTAREKKLLENSWAQILADGFNRLLTRNDFPNTPLNVIINAVVINGADDGMRT